MHLTHRGGWLVPFAVVSVLLQACGYYHYAGPIMPVADQGKAMEVADDGTVTFVRDRLEVSLRPLSAEELNRQFAEQSRRGLASTNPYTYGDIPFPEGLRPNARFTVFRLAVKNYSYPKVRIDPSRIVLRSAKGRVYWSLSLEQLTTYYRSYDIGYQGNLYGQYRERLDVLRRTMFKDEEVFSGQEKEGLVVFRALDPDVKDIEVAIQDAGLRFDYRNEPTETMSINYHFQRQVGRVYPGGRRVLQGNDG